MANDVEKRITAKMVLDSTGFNESLKGVNQNLSLAKSELKASSAQVGTFGSNLDKLKVNSEGLSKQIELQKQKVDIYRDSIEKSTKKLQDTIKVRDQLKTKLEEEASKYNEVVKQYGKESEEAKKVKTSLDALTEQYKKKEKQVESTAKGINTYTINMNKADAELSKMQDELRKTNNELSKTSNGWITASESLKHSSEKIKSAGSAVSSAGDKLLKLAAPIAGGIVASEKFAQSFEDSMAKVSTISDDTQVPLQDLGDEILKLSDDTGVAADDIADNVYDAISAGQQTGDAVNFVTNSTKLAKAGFAEAGQSLDLLTTILNAYKMKSSEVINVSDLLIQVQNKGKVTVGELSTDMGKVIPTAVATNTSLQQLGAGYAIMTNNGIKSAESTTYINSMLNELSKTGTDADNALRKMTKKSFSELMASGKSLADVLNILDGYAKKNKISLKDMFGSAEAGKAALVLSTNAGKDFNDMLSDMNNVAGATDQAFDKVTNTSGARLNKSLNELKNNSIKLGATLLPIMDEASGIIGKVADKLGSMDAEQVKTIANITLFTLGLGGVLKIGGGVISTVGSIAGGISKLSAAFGTASVAVEGVGTAAEVAAGVGGAGGLAGLGVALGGAALAAAPWLIAGAAIVGTGYYIHKKLNEDAIPAVDLFGDKTETTAKTVTDASGYMAVQYETNITKISDSTKKAVQSYLDLDKKATESMYDITTSSAKFTDNMKKDVISKFTEMINQSKALTQDMKDKQVNEFTVMVNQTNELTDYNKNKIVSTYSDMVNKIEGLTDAQKGFVIAGFQMTFSGVNQITQEQSKDIIAQYNQMGDIINQGLDKHKQEELAIFQNSFKNNTELTELEKNQILQSVTSEWEGKKTLTNIYEQQIKEIMTKASNERRQLTHEEQAEIADIQNRMKNEAVQALSDTELEAKVIKERMKDYDTRITAEQASEHIKKMNEQVEAVKSKANQEADEVIKAAIRKREAGSISDEEADKIIRSAEKQRDNTINAAIGQKDGVIKAMRDQNADLDREVNVTTGEIKKVKDEWTSGWGNTFKKLSVGFVSSFAGEANGQLYSHWIGANASGTDNWTGGLTTLHEKGYEVYDLPRGTRIYNHEASEDMVIKAAEAVARNMTSDNKGSSTMINFNGNYGFKDSNDIDYFMNKAAQLIKRRAK